ncbi:hypothetical protein BDW75DRAFT_223336 [Aspergillus navahoensis]
MADQCGFPGNSDLYGLGIRAGIYLQWLSAQIAAFFYLADTNTLFFNYIVFTVAIIVAVIVLVFQGETYTLEMVIMIYMFFGGLFCVQQRKNQFLQNREMSWRVLIRIVTVFAMLVVLGRRRIQQSFRCNPVWEHHLPFCADTAGTFPQSVLDLCRVVDLPMCWVPTVLRTHLL